MRRIIVGYDGSEPAGRALEEAARLAKLYGAGLTVLTSADDRLVREDGVVTMAADEGLARWIAEQGAARARGEGVADVTPEISLESPAEALIHATRGGCELLVVGHRGQGGLAELFLGSVAKTVVDRSECSVLVVR
jgi:nucleotide-binding universal stress UspA family protein